MNKFTWLALLFCSFCVQAEVVTITGKPIIASLPVGVEKIIELPSKGTIGLSNEARNKLKVEVSDSTVFLTAKEPFDRMRLICKLSNGLNFYLDVRASESASNEILRLTAGGLADNSSQALPALYADSIKFAVSQFFSPKRLISENVAYSRVPMRITQNVYINDQVIASPIASWKSGNLYVSAIQLKNISQYPFTLDLQDISGKVLASALFPKGPIMTGDMNHMLFLVTEQNLGEAFA